jgi:hypothetical protein
MMMAAMLASWLLIVPAMVQAEDSNVAGGKKFSWKPVRPSEQRALDQDQRVARHERSAAMRRVPKVHVDSRVKPAVLQQAADPLRNPFDDPMPRSPFRSTARQAELLPEPDEAPSNEGAASDSTATEDLATEPISTQQPSTAGPMDADPFSTVPQSRDGASGQGTNPSSQATEPSEPGRLLGQEPAPPIVGERPFGTGQDDVTRPEDALIPTDPKKDCDEALARFRTNRLTATTGRGILDLSLPRDENGAVAEPPFECNLGTERFALNSGREWAQTCYTWKASGLCHKPLYFEQSHMERYGHSWGPVIDPVISGAHFFASVPLLPYKMGVEPPCECMYPLGYYRPGNCAPHYIEPWPWSLRGAAAQAGVMTGLIYAVP